MLESVDCMHWRWKNCLASWHTKYTDHHRDLTIVVEAVASKDFWVWHCFFGLSESLNETNVLKRSHLFCRLTSGDDPA